MDIVSPGVMSPAAAKRRFNIPAMFRRIEQAVADYADAAMFELSARGYRSVFHQLVGCILSIRTFDEVSLPTALRLFDAAPDPAALAAMSVREIDRLIHASTFHEQKARNIREIARRTMEEFDGELPCDAEVLAGFTGVGPKCANLAIGVACGAAEIAVDVHVRRVTIRWGYVDEGNPEQVRRQLQERLPQKYWVEINRLLVPFGKHICTGRLPNCSTCPVLAYCRQVGVHAHR